MVLFRHRDVHDGQDHEDVGLQHDDQDVENCPAGAEGDLAEETERTAELFLSLKGKHSLMVVEHDMAFIRHIADVVTVLCDGSVLAQGSFDDVQANERVIEVYLGR